MRILVAGGAGTIDGDTTQYLLDHGHQGPCSTRFTGHRRVDQRAALSTAT